MVAGVAYSSFAFKPLWHPPLVRNASFAIQNTIPMECMKTLKFVFSCSQGKNHGKHIAARRAKHMRCAYEIEDFMELCFLGFGGSMFKQMLLWGGFCAKFRAEKHTQGMY